MKPLDFTISAETIAGGITQSELSLMDECAMKWNYRYNNLLQRADSFPWPLFIGQAWHSFQQGFHTFGREYDLETYTPPVVPKNIIQDVEFEKKMEYWQTILPAYQVAYGTMYAEEADHKWMIVEEEMNFEFNGWNIRGKIDLASDKPRFIRDYKSTASAWLTSPNGWHFKLQFMVYCWLMAKNNPEWAKKPFDFSLDLMQKPGLKQTAKETWPGHLQRVRMDIAARPEFYFRRATQVITQDAIKHFEKMVLGPKIDRLNLALDPVNISILTNMNTNACNSFGHQCEFFEICEKGWNMGKFFFEQRPTKHAELDGE